MAALTFLFSFRASVLIAAINLPPLVLLLLLILLRRLVLRFHSLVRVKLMLTSNVRRYN